MSKILVQVHVPAAGRRDDILIPYECDLGTVTELIKGLVGARGGGRFLPSDATLLCDATGKALALTSSPEACGLQNGSQLMLI